MDPAILQAAIFVLFGGAVFAIAVENLIPFFGLPKVDIRRTMIAMGSIATLFWSTWLFPMGVLLLILDRPIWIVIVLSFLFAVFVASTLITTVALGKFKGVPDDPKALKEVIKNDST